MYQRHAKPWQQSKHAKACGHTKLILPIKRIKESTTFILDTFCSLWRWSFWNILSRVIFWSTLDVDRNDLIYGYSALACRARVCIRII